MKISLTFHVATYREQTPIPFIPTAPVRDNKATTTRVRSSTARSPATTATTTPPPPPPPPTTTTTTTTEQDINSKLDLLQSNLDPWAHIQEQQKEQQEQEREQPVTAPTTSTTKFSLFNIRTQPPRATTSTTTFKPRSLADLFKHRAGQKVEYPEGSEPITKAPDTANSRVQNTSRRTPQVTRSRSRLNKFRPLTTTEVSTTLDPRLPKKTPTEFFETDQRAPPTVFRSTETTEKPNVKVIFNSIPVDKGFANVLPPDYQVGATSTSSEYSTYTVMISEKKI